ncbi:CAHD1-like protein [Mya arenaria]|uniref:CAHD1-like protein n=1 Tax=Mya arenaria TaxID=6604 RepID=A0ABY7FSX3_MYAAR|nr:CAHD1-like protein [Mya arenaria]
MRTAKSIARNLIMSFSEEDRLQRTILWEEGMVIYISRGLLSSLTDAKDVMSTIAYYNGRMDNRIIINTFAVIDNDKPIMYEKQFLQDIAIQNYTKYKVISRSKSPAGMMVAVNDTRDLSLMVGRFYTPFNKTTPEDAIFSLPYIDVADGALTMSISMACLNNKRPIGVSGYTIMHPTFTRPVKTNIQPMHTDIWHFENVPGFEEVRSNMLRRPEGEQTMYVTQTYNRSGSLVSQNVEDTPFIVAIKILQEQDSVKHLDNHVSLPNMVYHRIDILQANHLCMHLKQLATVDASTVFLSANSFVQPFEHLNQGVNKRMVQSYVAYLSDDTRLISNPGFKETVRNDVAATAGIEKVWMQRFKVSDMRNYVVRRYVTTPSGVFRSYPGALFHETPQSLHSTADKLVAVMGMDVTLGYFYKMVLDHISICKAHGMRCFLINDDGYMEPLVANDILNHRHFVHKQLCNRYNDRTIQRFYTFNTSLDEVLTNLVHGEHCARYQIVAVPGTNLFLGMINQTCDIASAFCPCSMVDRLCLNCNRMGQVECECPCECPLAMDFCNGDLLKSEDMNPSCSRALEREELAPVSLGLTTGLGQCQNIDCDSKTTHLDCLGVLGCEWCQVKSGEGYTKEGVEIHKPLPRPFCAAQATCFGGVVGAPTPYGDRAILTIDADEEPETKSAPPWLCTATGIESTETPFSAWIHCQKIRTGIHSHTNFVLATFENPASISPYRVNTSYRRPAGGDSDHGYSTMTPHDDSEHASLPCLEPLIAGKDRYKPGVHTPSKTPIIPPPPSVASRRSRSPTPPQTRISGYQPIMEQTDPSQTVLDIQSEHPHNILANVQVHMVDSH